MPDRRHWRLYLSVLALLVGGVFLTLSVLDSVSADTRFVLKPNRLGPLGGAIAYELRQSLGAAVYVFLTGWFVVAFRLVLRRGWLGWSLRSLGWLLLVPAAAVLAERWPEFAPTGAVLPLGPGGSIGAWLNEWLHDRLHPLGQDLLLSGCLTLGVILTLDDALRLLLRWLWRCIRANLDWPTIENRPAQRPGILPIVRTTPPAEAEESEEVEIPAPAAVESEEPAIGAKIIPIHHHNEMVRHESQGPHLFSTPRRKPPVETVSDRVRFADYELPSLKLLEDAQPFDYRDHDQQLRERAALLEKTFTDFGLNVHVVGINTGPVVTQFEIALETGLRVHKVTRLADDIALNLKVPSVRIVAPIPGKNTVGIEVPNELRADVRLKEVILASAKKSAKFKVPLFLGKDSEGRPLVYDLADMPHLLIAGTTGTGKSVCLNAIILSILMTRRPDEVKMIMIDPKGGVEMEVYSKIPHLMHPIVTDMKKSEAILAWAVDKMEERYDLLQPGPRPQHRRLQRAETRRDPPPRQAGGRRGTQANSAAHAVHRHRHRRDGRPDVADEEGSRGAHHPPGPEIAGGGHSPGRGHAEADGRCDHRPHQVEPAVADLLQGDEQDRTAASCSTRWAPTSCWARATCCFCRRAPAI